MASKLTEFYNGGQTGVHNDFQEDFTCHLAEAFHPKPFTVHSA